ncbi:hypothetical protein CUMW_250840 [Citrus unshiu]|uniref:Leucine-rich repeat-containing N-terminal plant-type domain-containing protein n=1 Tax=Citrus unshiu TaxID=55188 RepID=A0A2H5QPY8_CITUN|nr:hypothetical protein CUMW_250840 [Citrus unshiu]
MSCKLFLLLEYLALSSVILFQLEPRLGASNNITRCIDEEREALLTFKQSLVDEYGVLSSWGSEDGKRDCCKWRGVRCSNTTGHVKVLNLQTSDHEFARRKFLKGKISPALLKLRGLRHLDLSKNDFGGGSPVPEFIGSLSKLRYLNLSCGTPSSKIPHPFRDLSGFEYFNVENSNLFSVGSLERLSHLSSLRHLDLSCINLTKSSDWFQVVSQLHSLKTLVLRSCYLPPINPSFIWLFNLSTSIETLDLSDNHLPSSSVYPWLFNLSRNILHLDLGFNHLQGSIPEAFQHMVSLRLLSLASNELEGGIPKFFGNMCSLNQLYLPRNKLSGQFSELIQNLSSGCTVNSLEGLCLYANDITGPIPDLGRFSSLKVLKLGENHLNGTINKSLSHLFKLETLSLDGNSFTGVISETFFSNMSNLQILFLADNSLTLKLSHDWVPAFQLKWLSLASCKMGPHFPNWLQTQNQLISLDISNIGISDTIPDWFWDLSIELFFLNLSNNHISGKLPDLSLLKSDDIVIDISSNNFDGPIPPLPSNSTFLNLSKNKFSGLPDCWLNFNSLSILNLANNRFSGKIPDSMGFLHNIQTLSLRNNRLNGELPSSLKNCSKLRVLDLRKNALFGELCHLAFIQVLDLSLNNISGKIPKCFSNFSMMIQEKSSNPIIGLANEILVVPGYIYYFRYLDNVLLTWKGSEHEYKSTLGFVKYLDLSSNKLCEAIPEEITDLLQSFNASVYAGNLELCGLPLPNKCADEESTPSPGRDDDANTVEDEDNQFITLGFYVSLTLGFFVGFWGVCGTLMLNRSWRYGYYNFLTGMKDWLYTAAAMNKSNLQTKFRVSLG